MSTPEVIQRLDILISLLTPRFDEKRYPVKGLGMEILKLSDGEHTLEEICKKLKKKRTQVEPTLSKLRSQGYVKSINKGSKIFYVRL